MALIISYYMHINQFNSLWIQRQSEKVFDPQIMPQVLPLEGTWIHMDTSVLIISANKIINFSCLKVKTYEKTSSWGLNHHFSIVFFRFFIPRNRKNITAHLLQEFAHVGHQSFASLLWAQGHPQAIFGRVLRIRSASVVSSTAGDCHR